MKIAKQCFVLMWIVTFFSCATGPSQTVTIPEQEPDGLSQIVQTMTSAADSLPSKTIAVISFCDLEGKDIAEGDLFAQRLVAALVNDGTFQVVERQQIDKILSEQR